MHFLLGIAHFLMSLLQVIEFFLLFGCEQRTDFAHGIIHHGVRLLHRVLMNGHDLRLGLIDNRLDLGLLIGREIQRFGQPLEPKCSSSAPVPTVTAPMPRVCLDEGKPAEHDASGSRKCKEVSFHSLICCFCLSSDPFRGSFHR